MRWPIPGRRIATRCSCQPPRCRSTASGRSISISSRATTRTGSRPPARRTPASGNRVYGKRANDAQALLADVVLLGLYDVETTRLDALIVDGRAFPIDRLDLGFHADFDPEAAH